MERQKKNRGKTKTRRVETQTVKNRTDMEEEERKKERNEKEHREKESKEEREHKEFELEGPQNLENPRFNSSQSLPSSQTFASPRGQHGCFSQQAFPSSLAGLVLL